MEEYYLVKTMKNNVTAEKHKKKYNMASSRKKYDQNGLQHSKDTKFIVALW